MLTWLLGRWLWWTRASVGSGSCPCKKWRRGRHCNVISGCRAIQITRRRYVGKPVPKYDGLLIGPWRSDRRRTFRHFKPKPGCPPRSLRKLKSIFGKLVIRWGRGRHHTEMDGHHESAAYEVVARDASSVVVRF